MSDRDFPGLENLHDDDDIRRAGGETIEADGLMRVRDLERALAPHGIGRTDELFMLRCPCHREPLVAFYGQGRITLRCAHSGDEFAGIKVAE